MKKYLWQPVESADALAVRLKTAAENKSEDLAEIAVQAADRLLQQQNQIGGFMNLLLSQMAPEKVVELLLKAGISRHELTSCWGVPADMAVRATEHVNTARTYEFRPDE